MYELEPRFITVAVVTFIVCSGVGTTVYMITHNGFCTWLVIAIAYTITFLVMSVLTRDRT